MKKIAKQFLILSLIFSFAGCQKDNNQPTEVRFVDLQGKPKPIKTRVPEANAKIMSGQISHSDNIEINNSSAKNKSSDFSLESYKKNFINSNNSANKIGVIEKDNSSNSEQTVEYDLGLENNAKKIEKSDFESQEIELKQDNSSNKNFKNAENSEIFEEDLQNSQSSQVASGKNLYKNTANNLEHDEEGNKIITYSTKKYKKTSRKNSKEFGLEDNQELNDSKTEDSSVSNYKTNNKKTSKVSKYYSSGKAGYYVQVGAFNNSSGARERLALITNQKNGKVITATLNERKIYRSVFGPYSSKNQALKVKNSIENNGNEAIIIRK